MGPFSTEFDVIVVGSGITGGWAAKEFCERGFKTLVLTVDVPLLSRRPRELKARLKNPMTLAPRVVVESALAPVWALGHFGRPIPHPKIFDKYTKGMTPAAGDKHIGLTLRCAPDWAYLEALRSEWDGPLIVKGVLDPDLAPHLIDAGADALWVSNHGGRQFSAAPAAIDALGPVLGENARVLLPRAQIAREVLPDTLRATGATVDVVTAYRNVRPKDAEIERIRKLVDPGEADAILFTSSSTVRNLHALLGDDATERLNAVASFSIGPVTSRTAEELGIVVTATAAEPSIESLVETVRAYYAEGQDGSA